MTTATINGVDHYIEAAKEATARTGRAPGQGPQAALRHHRGARDVRPRGGFHRRSGRHHRTDLPVHLPGLPRLRRDGSRPLVPDPDLVLLADPQPHGLLSRRDPGPARVLRLRDRRDRALHFVRDVGHQTGGRAAASPNAATNRSISSPPPRSTAAPSSSSTCAWPSAAPRSVG